MGDAIMVSCLLIGAAIGGSLIGRAIIKEADPSLWEYMRGREDAMGNKIPRKPRRMKIRKSRCAIDGRRCGCEENGDGQCETRRLRDQGWTVKYVPRRKRWWWAFKAWINHRRGRYPAS